MNKLIILFSALAAVLIISCSEDSNTTETPTGTTDLETERFTDLNADTSNPADFAYFSFSENKAIPASDSNTTKWDIAFGSTNIICNSGVRGPGNGMIQLLDGVDFASLEEAPESGYYAEDQYSPTALNKSNGVRWYNYNPVEHIITPVPGTVIVLKTADGKYAKVRIISYYKGDPEVPTQEDLPRYYTFDFVYQPDGSRKF